jgi:uncharacterized membrane protein YhaH (DUF805 family)
LTRPDDTAPARPVDWFSTIGRRGRLSFLANFAFVNIGISAISFIGETAEGPMPRLIATACALVGAWVNLCLVAQRLHDTGHSGWLQVVPFALGLLGIALMVVAQPLAWALGAAMLFAGWLGFLVWLVAAPGDPADNRFGAASSRSQS